MQKIILVGNPNTGKTTLFNTLAKADEHASNWHGVTVDVKEKKIKINEKEYLLCDLPGLYSLSTYSKEEKIAAEFIEQNKGEIFVCITDANNLRRNLYLCLELKERVKNLILAVNMAKEVKGFSAEALAKELGVQVVSIDARKTKSAKNLKELINQISTDVKDIGNEGQLIVDLAKEKNFSLESFENMSERIFTKIDNILAKVEYKTNGYYGFSWLDKIVLSPVLGFIVFALVMTAVFFITFGEIGSFLSTAVSQSFELVIDGVMNFLSGFITNEIVLDFLREGVFGGALAVVGFMPQIVLMFLCLNLLEDFGYLSRVAFMFDGVFKRFGLTGRSVFSLIMGFGCTTTAVMTTRNLDSNSLRKRTAVMLPFMSCSAKLPIYAVICSAFFVKYKAIIVFCLYIFAILLALLVAFIMKMLGAKKETEETFLLEMPKYRMPSFVKTGKGAFSVAKSFLSRVGGVLVVSSIAVYLMCNFSLTFKYVGNGDGKSILEWLAGAIAFLFKPLGFGTAGAVVAIISGLIAKEMVVSSLVIVNGCTAGMLAETLISEASPVHFTPLSAISFLVFILLYSPCVSAIISMKKEVGSKVAWKSVAFQFALAYVCSGLVYGLGLLIQIKLWWVALIVLIVVALLVFVVLKCIQRRLKNKNSIQIKTCDCTSCKEKCYGDNKL